MDYSCSGASLGCGTRFTLFPGYISPSARGATRVPGRSHEEADELAPVGPDSREITTLSIQPSTNFVRAPDSMRVFGLLHKLHREVAPQKIKLCGGALLTPLFFLEQSAWSWNRLAEKPLSIRSKFVSISISLLPLVQTRVYIGHQAQYNDSVHPAAWCMRAPMLVPISNLILYGVKITSLRFRLLVTNLLL
jgi:hypothetical protein